MNLSMGSNAALTQKRFFIDIQKPSGGEIDISAFQVYPGGKIRGDEDVCFYNQTSISGGALFMTRRSGDVTRFDIQLDGLPSGMEKLVFTATLDGSSGFSALRGGFRLSAGETVIEIPCVGRSERALIIAEIYQRNGVWKIRHVGQGFNGGLAALATHFGADIAAPSPRAPAPPPAPVVPPAPPKPVSLSKISLTKNENRVSLAKKGARFGRIRVNLNWSNAKSGGLFGFGKRAIDLDVGAFIESKSGLKTAVQALGNSFGSYESFPYTFLNGDDRTGAVSDGEWLDINGERWSELRRVLIYAFIYDGVPNWQATDGVVRVLVPDQPEVEVRMNEFGSSDPMCAIVLLENENDQIRVSREMRFFRGHPLMDQAYGWGLKWVAGRK